MVHPFPVRVVTSHLSHSKYPYALGSVFKAFVPLVCLSVPVAILYCLTLDTSHGESASALPHAVDILRELPAYSRPLAFPYKILWNLKVFKEILSRFWLKLHFIYELI